MQLILQYKIIFSLLAETGEMDSQKLKNLEIWGNFKSQLQIYDGFFYNPFCIFQKKLHLDVWLGFEYTSRKNVSCH